MSEGWKIAINQKASKTIDRAPEQVRGKYELWHNSIEESGPLAVRVNNSPGFRDHALIGDWAGFRSSYLNKQYRVIYSIDEVNRCVRVEKVGPHDY